MRAPSLLAGSKIDEGGPGRNVSRPGSRRPTAYFLSSFTIVPTPSASTIVALGLGLRSTR